VKVKYISSDYHVVTFR